MTAESRTQARFGLCQDVDGVVAAMLERALKVMGTAMGNVQLIDWATKPSLEIAAQRGFEDEFLETFRSVSATSPSACGRALVTRDMIIIEDVLLDVAFAPFRAAAQRAGFRSVLSTPMISTGGALYGVVSTHHERTGRPDDRQIAAMRNAAQQAADAIMRLRARPATLAGGAIGAEPA